MCLLKAEGITENINDRNTYCSGQCMRIILRMVSGVITSKLYLLLLTD